MASLTATMLSQVRPFAATAPRPAARTVRAVRCMATSDSNGSLIDRRQAILALTSIPALATAFPALALLDYEDDEELIEKAKANRKARLAKERETEEAFQKLEGYISKTGEKELIPVQKAVTKLAKSGSQIESGDLTGLVATISESWVADFQKAAVELSSSAESKKSADVVLKGISSIEASAKAGSLSGAKSSFVTTVSALRSWTDATGVTSYLKGL